MPIDAITFQCPLLNSVTIQCSKGDDGIDKMVNAMVANGVSLDRIHTTFYKDIEKSEREERVRVRQEEEKELRILQKTLKANREWIDDDKYATSASDEDDDEDSMDEMFASEYDPDYF
ncbi:hypothetical protein BAE44_0012515 [Dichanthelium oligosanthes]|uniref:Uncharacterized protein n=1 Tax=Dichanthelium oligosanthes TaxID=888268 RepID=A0A1E5VMW2_9POAL|nr:hypothetical protein BAE44_0012515 [Dichanthelium oligosanthes]